MSQQVTDLVCGMTINKKDAAATYIYEGETFYFCAPGCKVAFSKDPEKYIGREEDSAGGHDHA